MATRVKQINWHDSRTNHLKMSAGYVVLIFKTWILTSPKFSYGMVICPTYVVGCFLSWHQIMVSASKHNTRFRHVPALRLYAGNDCLRLTELLMEIVHAHALHTERMTSWECSDLTFVCLRMVLFRVGQHLLADSLNLLKLYLYWSIQHCPGWVSHNEFSASTVTTRVCQSVQSLSSGHSLDHETCFWHHIIWSHNFFCVPREDSVMWLQPFTVSKMLT